jgi:hypothetical protein
LKTGNQKLSHNCLVSQSLVFITGYKSHWDLYIIPSLQRSGVDEENRREIKCHKVNESRENKMVVFIPPRESQTDSYSQSKLTQGGLRDRQPRSRAQRGACPPGRVAIEVALVKQQENFGNREGRYGHHQLHCTACSSLMAVLSRRHASTELTNLHSLRGAQRGRYGCISPAPSKNRPLLQ